MSQLERIGISLDNDLLAMFDELLNQQGYANRSEAVRDLIRQNLSEQQLEKPNTEAVAGLFVVYDHHATNLSQKMTHLQHNHVSQIIASLHVHLDHHNCLEVILLRGKVGDVQKTVDQIRALKGVKLSRINIMTTGQDLP